MSAIVNCPAFGCVGGAPAPCPGFAKKCNRFYCETHNRDKLCIDCKGRKIESLKAGYKQLFDNLWKKSHRTALTAAVILLASVGLLLLSAAFVVIFSHGGGNSHIRLFVGLLVAGVAGLAVSLFRYIVNARNFMYESSVELDLTNPGFFNYYVERRERIDQITSSSN